MGLGVYRRRLDIVADMLLVASRGAKKTQIMYQANLSYKLLNKYLAEIRRAYLVSFERKKRCYVLTSKGQQFLETYKDYSRRNKHVEKGLNDVSVKRKALEELCSSSR
jgi:predicted transcriptional regulator